MVNEYVDEGIPFLRSQNILPFRVNTENLKFIPPSFHARLRKSALRPGDVAVVRTGYPGTAAVVPEWLGDANCADLVILTPGSGLDAFFLTAVLNSTWGIASIGGRLVGSAQQHFNVGAARRLEVHVPPLPTQRKIAAILSAHDDHIENNRRRIKLLEEMAQRIYREWFVDYRYPGHEGVPLVDSEMGQIPTGWSVHPLFEVADVTFGFPFKSALFNGERGLPVIRIRDILSGESATFTTETPAPIYRVMDGDVLIGMDGDFHMGKWSAGEAWLNQRVTRVRVTSGAMSRYALFLALEKPIADWNRAIVGTTVAHLGKSHLQTIKVLTPPASLATIFSGTLDSIFDLEISLRKATRHLRSTRDLLLPRLISGEIDVSDLDVALPQAAA